MKTITDTPAIVKCRGALLDAVNTRNRFKLALAIEAMIDLKVYAALAVHTSLAPEAFEDKTAKSLIDRARDELIAKRAALTTPEAIEARRAANDAALATIADGTCEQMVRLPNGDEVRAVDLKR